MRTDAVLLVDKPEGPSSHDVVRVARRQLDESRIGHAGTLDPFASGLLVLLVGRATRLLPFMDSEPKVYRAVIRFGAEYDTDDPTGMVTHEAPPPDSARIDAALAVFTGELQQVPPAYSAASVDGRRAYRAARAGQPLELSPRTVRVHGWDVQELSSGELTAELSCSGGTYVRALARDIGRHCGSAAHLRALRRLSSGCFTVANASTLEQLKEGDFRLQPAIEALGSMPRVPVDADGARRLAHGLRLEGAGAEGRAAAVSEEGDLLAVLEARDDSWQPKVVLVDA